MRAPGDSQGQALATGQAVQALATGEGDLSWSHGLAHATPAGLAHATSRAGWAVYWKATGPEVVS